MIKQGVVINSGTITNSVSLTDGVLTIAGACTVQPGNLKTADTALVAAVGETLAHATVTPTATTVDLTTQFQVNQFIPGRGITSIVVSHVTFTGDTATTICDALREQLQQSINSGVLQVALTGTATLVVTALTGYPVVTVVAGSNCSVGTVQAGVTATGTADYILAQYPEASVTAGAAYSYAHIVYNSPASEVAGVDQKGVIELDLWVNVALTGYAAFATEYAGAMDTILPTYAS